MQPVSDKSQTAVHTRISVFRKRPGDIRFSADM